MDALLVVTRASSEGPDLPNGGNAKPLVESDLRSERGLGFQRITLSYPTAMSNRPKSERTSVGGSDQHLVRRCVTHHFACDCREAFMAESMQTQRRVIDWHSQSDEGLRLRCGELSAQEIRTIRAVLAAILPPNS